MKPHFLRSKTTHAEAGFSLIEVMIAIVIMAVLSLIAWRGLDSMSRTNTALQMRTEETAKLMRTLQQIERDLIQRALSRTGGNKAAAAGLLLLAGSLVATHAGAERLIRSREPAATPPMVAPDHAIREMRCGSGANGPA